MFVVKSLKQQTFNDQRYFFTRLKTGNSRKKRHFLFYFLINCDTSSVSNSGLVIFFIL